MPAEPPVEAGSGTLSAPAKRLTYFALKPGGNVCVCTRVCDQAGLTITHLSIANTCLFLPVPTVARAHTPDGAPPVGHLLGSFHMVECICPFSPFLLFSWAVSPQLDWRTRGAVILCPLQTSARRLHVAATRGVRFADGDRARLGGPCGPCGLGSGAGTQFWVSSVKQVSARTGASAQAAWTREFSVNESSRWRGAGGTGCGSDLRRCCAWQAGLLPGRLVTLTWGLLPSGDGASPEAH